MKNKISNNAVEGDEENLKEFIAPMVDLGTYAFKDLNTGSITPK